jgi:CheY-like chemotaxis protein
VPKKVLLADDSATIQRVVELTFAGEDVSVLSVGDGEQAVAAIRQSPPDLVLADIGMPGRTGYEVVEFVRSQPSLGSLPVLLLAGAFEPIDEARARRAGADGILTKPFDPAVLVGRVRELLQSGRGSAPIIVGPIAATPPILRTQTPGAQPSTAPALAQAATTPVQPEQHDGSDRQSSGPSVASERSQAAGPTETDRYFAEIDEAFASLSRRARAPGPRTPDDAAAPGDVEPTVADTAASTPTRGVPLTDAFAALLEAEQTGAEVSMPATAAVAPPALDVNALAEQIARRVLEQLSDRVVREAVAEIVATTAERLVREEIEQIKRNIK